MEGQPEPPRGEPARQGFNHHGMKLPWQVTRRAKNSPQPTFQLDNSEGPGQSFIYWEKMR